METIEWLHYDSFSNQPNKGNPAGVVFLEYSLPLQQQQRIAKIINFNETVFITHSTCADFKFKFFAPSSEMDFCGHALLAGAVAILDKKKTLKNSLSIETNVGIASITISKNKQVTMTQKEPLFTKFSGSIADIADLLSIKITDIDNSFPIVYGNTGTWTLIVPIKHLSCFKEMTPLTKQFPKILTEFPASSIHPICLETRSQEADMYSRHFSGAYTGAIEDAVTGSAAGVMGAYYSTYISEQKNNEFIQLHMEQGYELKREGIVLVNLLKQNDIFTVSITGTATFVTSSHISI